MKAKRVLIGLFIGIFSWPTLASDQSFSPILTGESDYSRQKFPPPLHFTTHPKFKLDSTNFDKEQNKDKTETEIETKIETDNAPFPSFDEQEGIFPMEEEALLFQDSKEKFISFPHSDKKMKKLKEAKAAEKKETTDFLSSSSSSEGLNSSNLRKSQPISIDKSLTNKIIDMDDSIRSDKIETTRLKSFSSVPQKEAYVPAKFLRFSDGGFKRGIHGAAPILPSATPANGTLPMAISYGER